MDINKLFATEQTIYSVVAISKDGQHAKVKNHKTEVEKDWQLSWMKQRIEDGTIKVAADGQTFTMTKTERKIEY